MQRLVVDLESDHGQLLDDRVTVAPPPHARQRHPAWCGAVDVLRARPEANGKVGVIGYCSGGRQSWLVACTLDVDAAVDCYGGRADVGLAPGLRCPLLGLFGKDDQFPSPDDVAAMAQALEAEGKTFDFHSYDGAGHAFFSPDRPSYDLDAAKDGWKRIWAFFGQHLRGA